jgi:hypothetical protein
MTNDPALSGWRKKRPELRIKRIRTFSLTARDRQAANYQYYIMIYFTSFLD